MTGLSVLGKEPFIALLKTMHFDLLTSLTAEGRKKKWRGINKALHDTVETPILHSTGYGDDLSFKAKVTTVIAFLPTLVVLDDRGGQLPS